jgi:dolichol-phosphate mannosyltransferase
MAKMSMESVGTMYLVATAGFPGGGRTRTPSSPADDPLTGDEKGIYSTYTPPITDQDNELMQASETIDSKPHLSVVSPVYGCADVLPELCEQLEEHLSNITKNYEVILVNDASPDGAWEAIQSLAKGDSRIKGVDLSRNFGQQAAITAGLSYSIGEWVVVMDCDLQDQPKEIPKLYAKAQEGYEVVFGRRHQRQDKSMNVAASRLYRRVFNYFTESKNDPAVANFGIYKRAVIDAFLTMRERNRGLQLFIRWLGFRNTAINIEHAARSKGKSAYHFGKLFRMALSNIVSQSNKPLKISIGFGFLMALAAFIYAGFRVYIYLRWDTPVAGWTSVIVSIYFIGGLLFANLGILGLYLGKVFDETKARPLYVIRQRTWSES